MVATVPRGQYPGCSEIDVMGRAGLQLSIKVVFQ